MLVLNLTRLGRTEDGVRRRCPVFQLGWDMVAF